MRSLLGATALLLALSATTMARPTWDQLTPNYSFDTYCEDHGKFYEPGSPEYYTHKAVFEQELKDTLRHNSQLGVSYKRGVNQFSDLSREEKKSRMLFRGLQKVKPGSMPAHNTIPETLTALGEQNHASVDYRKNVPAVLTTVKDQGECGSCWSHGTTEAIETYTAFHTGKLHVLSQQQLVSCCPVFNLTIPIGDGQKFVDPMHGCDGYLPNEALDYMIKEQKGRMWSEWMFPYTSYFDQMNQSHQIPPVKCLQPHMIQNFFTNVTGYTMLPTNDQNAIVNHLSTNGPLITMMYCPNEFFSYESGVFHSKDCVGYPEMQPSHVVMIVGYGRDDNLKMDYFILRNSWNSNWGEDGYFRVLKTDPNVCGYMPVPQKKGGYHEAVNSTSCGTCGIETYTLFPHIGHTAKPKP